MMKNQFTYRILLLAIIILLIESNKCIGQNIPLPNYFPGFSPVYYNRAPNSPIPPYFNTVNVKKTYVITLKNDSIITVFAKINIARSSKNPNSIIIPDGKKTRMIHPDDTKEIYELKADGSKYYGIPAKNSWLFVTRTGKITCYTVIPEPDCDYITAIQKGNEPIVDLNLENLKPLISDNADATRLAVKDKELVIAIKVYNEQNK